MVIKFWIGSLALLIAPLVGAIEVDYRGKDPSVQFAVRDACRILSGVEGRIVLEIDPEMASQEWSLRSREDDVLVIRGRDGLGLSYGIFTLLEDFAGVRWLAPDTELIPDLRSWRIPQLDVRGRPAMLSREMFVGTDYMDGYWRFRNKETARVAFSAGVSVGKPFQCHTFSTYALAITNDSLRAVNDKGRIDAQNLCFTKPEVRALVANRMIEFIDSERLKATSKERQYTLPTVYELSQNDGGDGGCRCKDCLAFYKNEGSWSGPNLDFVNGVADIVGKRYPDITIRTFAYAYTELPPRSVRARDNVRVRFCRSFTFSPLTKGSYNGSVLERWNDFASQKAVWGYWRQYSGCLFPLVKSRRDIKEELRFCRDCGVKEYFAQSESPLSRSFGLMQDWLFLKMSENPDRDIMKLSREFLAGYYGAAAKIMDEYLTYLELRLDKVWSCLDHRVLDRMNSGDQAQYVVLAGFPDVEFFTKAESWFDIAERLAGESGDERSLRHVREERAVVDRAIFDFWPQLSRGGFRVDFKAKALRYGEVKRAQAKSFFGGRGEKERQELGKRISFLEREVAYFSAFPLASPVAIADAEDVISLGWNNCGVSGGEPVFDNTAPGGVAYALAGKADVIFGYYSGTSEKMGGEIRFGAGESSGESFKMFRVATEMDMQSPHYVYLNGWQRRVWIPSVGLPPEKRDVWINAKVRKDGVLLFDRIFLVKRNRNLQTNSQKGVVK